MSHATWGAADVISVRIGEMKIAGPPAVLAAVGIGSCVVVAVRDRRAGTGGMAHIMLPWLPKKPREGTNRYKYTDYAIERMVEETVAVYERVRRRTGFSLSGPNSGTG